MPGKVRDMIRWKRGQGPGFNTNKILTDRAAEYFVRLVGGQATDQGHEVLGRLQFYAEPGGVVVEAPEFGRISKAEAASIESVLTIPTEAEAPDPSDTKATETFQLLNHGQALRIRPGQPYIRLDVRSYFPDHTLRDHLMDTDREIYEEGGTLRIGDPLLALARANEDNPNHFVGRYLDQPARELASRSGGFMCDDILRVLVYDTEGVPSYLDMWRTPSQPEGLIVPEDDSRPRAVSCYARSNPGKWARRPAGWFRGSDEYDIPDEYHDGTITASVIYCRGSDSWKAEVVANPETTWCWCRPYYIKTSHGYPTRRAAQYVALHMLRTAKGWIERGLNTSRPEHQPHDTDAHRQRERYEEQDRRRAEAEVRRRESRKSRRASGEATK